MGEIFCFFPSALAAGKSVALVVRPEHIAIWKCGGSGVPGRTDNRLTGQVTREIYLGEIVEYLVAVGGGEILVRTPFGSVAKGDAVTLTFPPECTIALAQP